MTEAEMVRHYADVRNRLMNSPAPPAPPIPRHRFVMRMPKIPKPAWVVIVHQVAEKSGFGFSDLVKYGDRRSVINLARFECYYRIKTEITMPDGNAPSYPQIGKWFGGRDHTTIMHGVKRWAKMNGLAVPG
jgi:hypothetical protein